jgi:hypothetical protein
VVGFALVGPACVAGPQPIPPFSDAGARDAGPVATADGGVAPFDAAAADASRPDAGCVELDAAVYDGDVPDGGCPSSEDGGVVDSGTLDGAVDDGR